MNKKIAIMTFSDVNKEPRVIKQINTLKNKYDIDIFSYTKFTDKKIKTHILKKEKKITKILIHILNFIHLFKLTTFLKSIKLSEQLKKNNYQIIILRTITELPSIIEKNPHTKIVFDAPEYFYDQHKNRFHDLFLKPLYTWICNNYLPKCSSITTVGKNIAEKYTTKINKKVTVLMNVPFLNKLKAIPVKYEIKLVHHGVLNKDRGIDLLVELMKYTDSRFKLYLYLKKEKSKTYRQIEKKIKKNKKIILKNHVPYEQLLYELNKYDLGIYMLKHTSFNTANALPNKFFEFIQARLGVIIAPSYEMEKIIKKEKIGLVTKDFSPKTMAKELNKLTNERIWQFKKNSDRIAKKYSEEVEWKKFGKIIEDLINENKY